MRNKVDMWGSMTLALLACVGFFALVFLVLMGFVDARDPSTSTLVGTALGYASSKLETVFNHYFTKTGKADTAPDSR